jgi:hypothetical protein
MEPEDLVGWIVLVITSDGESQLLSNAKNTEQVRETLRIAADNVPDIP